MEGHDDPRRDEDGGKKDSHVGRGEIGPESLNSQGSGEGVVPVFVGLCGRDFVGFARMSLSCDVFDRVWQRAGIGGSRPEGTFRCSLL